MAGALGNIASGIIGIIYWYKLLMEPLKLYKKSLTSCASLIIIYNNSCSSYLVYY